ncbi:MAG: OmpA family protein [Granulosicoccus sp.]|nr:OmpA family protein [Granulosicoccus sp.]
MCLLICLLISSCGATPYRPVVKDTDNDSVADKLDQCPLTEPGNPVDQVGCSLFRGQLDAVDFGPGDDYLSMSSRVSLSGLIELLNEHPEVVVQLGGHTDNVGSASENLDLSKRRVMSVVKYLVANGVDGERLKPFGFGESRPIVSNTTAAGRAQNRRIELSVITQ